MDVEAVKKNFLRLKEEKGLTWADIAKLAGVSNFQTIYGRISGKGMSLATITKLAAFVEVEPWELLKPQDTTQPEPQEHNQQPTQAPGIICPYCGKAINIHATKAEETHQNELGQITPKQEDVKNTLF